MVSSPKSSSIDYSRLPSSTTRDQAQSTTRISSSISTDHHQASSHTESDQEEEEAEEEDHHHHHHHQAQSTSFFNQQPPITHQDPSQQEPCPTSSFIISSIILLGLFFTFFLLAPTIYRLFHSIRPSTQIQPLDPHHPQTTHSSPSAESTTHETDHRPIRPATWNDHPLDSDRTLTQTRSNGTHQFNTTLILVSLDGFRAEYLKRNLTPRMTMIKEKLGIQADYLKPQFPTLTFPNHWSMLTGLYPESHGIVANEFRDPKIDKSFSNVDPHKSWDPVWWLGEPIWAIATKHGIPTAVSMWPGPPYTSDKTRPTYWRAFEDQYKWWKKIRQLEKWLDLPMKDRPQLITLYVPEVDQIGHHYGPDDVKLNQTLQSVDQFVGSLYDSLKRRNLTEIVDVIYVGDHGMMATDDSSIVYLDQILGSDYFNQIQYQDGWPAAGLRFPAGVDTKPILDKLLEKSTSLPGFEVYTHHTMPKRWHFTNSERIAPIYVIPKPGWVISNTHEHQVVMNGTYNLRGVHGYDNEERSMRSIFIGHGPFSDRIRTRQLDSIRKGDSPRLRSRPNSNLNQASNTQLIVGNLPGFSNLEIFSLVSKLLHLDRFIDFNRLNCSIGFWDEFF